MMGTSYLLLLVLLSLSSLVHGHCHDEDGDDDDPTRGFLEALFHKDPKLDGAKSCPAIPDSFAALLQRIPSSVKKKVSADWPTRTPFALPPPLANMVRGKSRAVTSPPSHCARVHTSPEGAKGCLLSKEATLAAKRAAGHRQIAQFGRHGHHQPGWAELQDLLACIFPDYSREGVQAQTNDGCHCSESSTDLH